MANGYRKMAYVGEVIAVEPVVDSDFLDVVKVLGWQAVVRRDSFKVGDRGVFFEADTKISKALGRKIDERNEMISEGIKVKISKIRGVVSQGLLLPIEDFYNAFGKDVIENNANDLTVVLGLNQPEVREVINDGGLIRGFHKVISKTDEVRGQSNPGYLDSLQGKPFYITEKIDGTSRTIVFEDGQFRFFTRKNEVADVESDALYKILENTGVIDSIRSAGEDVFLQGEFYGEGIQKNTLKIKGKRYAVFNIGNPKTGVYYDRADWDEVLNRIDPQGNLELVNVVETGEAFNYSYGELAVKANEFYEGTEIVREGIVIRPLHEDTLGSKKFGKRLSFKILSDNYEIKYSKNTRRNKARDGK